TFRFFRARWTRGLPEYPRPSWCISRTRTFSRSSSTSWVLGGRRRHSGLTPTLAPGAAGDVVTWHPGRRMCPRGPSRYESQNIRARVVASPDRPRTSHTRLDGPISGTASVSVPAARYRQCVRMGHPVALYLHRHLERGATRVRPAVPDRR